MSRLYLETPAGKLSLKNQVDEEAVAELVISLLCDGTDVVKLRSKRQKEWCTLWAVLERDGGGFPVQVGTQDYDGEMEVISMEAG